MPPPCTELLREGVAEPWTEVSRGRPAPQFHMDMPPWREFSRETSGLGCLPTPQFHIETPLCCDESRDGAGVPATDGGPLQSHMPELERLSVLSPGCTDRRGLKFCPPCIDGFGVSPRHLPSDTPVPDVAVGHRVADLNRSSGFTRRSPARPQSPPSWRDSCPLLVNYPRGLVRVESHATEHKLCAERQAWTPLKRQVIRGCSSGEALHTVAHGS